MIKMIRHEYAADGKCVACGQTACGDAFWAKVGDGIGMPRAPDGTSGLRLRPDKAPEWISPETKDSQE